jgi:hypothetical protein
MRLSTKVIIIWALTVTIANAGDSSNSMITRIHPDSRGVFFFHTDSEHTDIPACHNQGGRWAINPDTSSGKLMVATVLTAYSLGKKISVSGWGVCDIWADTESVRYLYTE